MVTSYFILFFEVKQHISNNFYFISDLCSKYFPGFVSPFEKEKAANEVVKVLHPCNPLSEELLGVLFEPGIPSSWLTWHPGSRGKLCTGNVPQLTSHLRLSLTLYTFCFALLLVPYRVVPRPPVPSVILGFNLWNIWYIIHFRILTCLNHLAVSLQIPAAPQHCEFHLTSLH